MDFRKGLLDAASTVFPGIGIVRAAAGLGASAAQKAPVNMRLYAGTIMGDRSPVTEKNFDAETLGALRDAAADSIAKHNEDLLNQRQVMQRVAAQPKGSWFGMETGPDGKMHDITREDVLRGAQNELQRRLQPPTIQYDNYRSDPLADKLNDEGWLEGIVGSFTDPTFRAETSVGRAKLQMDKAGNTYVVDSYDWNHRKGLSEELKKDPVGGVATILGSLLHPTTFGNVIGTLMAPQEDKVRRPVRINLGLVKPAKGEN